jgi:hypothetical protein
MEVMALIRSENMGDMDPSQAMMTMVKNLIHNYYSL